MKSKVVFNRKKIKKDFFFFEIKIQNGQLKKGQIPSPPILNIFWPKLHELVLRLIGLIEAGVCCGPCNPSKWEADFWGWLEVRRSARLHYTVNQRPHWACRQYGHPGGTRGWLGVERYQLCKLDTSSSTKWYRRATVGHWDSLCVKCSGMVDSVPIWHTISIL